MNREYPLSLTVPGLVNFGNTCYANALLQALASCDSYVEYVNLIHETLPATNPMSEMRASQELEWQARMPLLRSISCCLERLQPTSLHDKPVSASALEVLHAIGYHNRKLFSGDGEQQDVTEALDCVISAARSELKAWQRVHLYSPVSHLASPTRNSCTYPSRTCESEEVNFSGILMNGVRGPRLADQSEKQALSMVQFQSSGAFEGLLSHHLECKECGHVFDIQLNRFTSLMLPITQMRMEDKEVKVDDQTCLEHCLTEYFSNKIQGPILCPRCSFYCTLTSVTKTDLNSIRGRRKSESNSTHDGAEERSSFEEEINNFAPVKRPGLTDVFISYPAFYQVAPKVASSTSSSSSSSISKKLIPSISNTSIGGGIVLKGATSFDLKEFQNNHLKPRKSESHVREAAARKAMQLAHNCTFQDHNVTSMRRTLIEGGISWVDVDSPVNARAAISKLPKVLSLSLQRKVYTGTGYKKIQGRIRYPLTLDLTNYLQHRSVHNTLYRLKAVIVHFGDETEGHYLTVRSVKAQDGRSVWLLASDDKIRCVSENAALGLEASMLFYEREPDIEQQSAMSQEAPVFLAF